jgi:hypothetical protein
VDVIEYFRTRARVPIRGTINGFEVRSSLMPCGGGRMMPVNQTLCRGAGVAPGDVVDVVMERDKEERTVEAPPELRRELAKSKRGRRDGTNWHLRIRRRWRIRFRGRSRKRRRNGGWRK